jgi:hypothetical protein
VQLSDTVGPKRRGGRVASGKQPVKRRRPEPEGGPIDPEVRRQETVLTRRLKACTCCERQKIRVRKCIRALPALGETDPCAQCVPDAVDPLGPCLTCLRSKQACPRFVASDSSSVEKVRQLMPHKVDVYRVHIQSFDAEDPSRVYIIEPSELSGLGNLNLPISDLFTNLNRYLDRVVVPLLLVTFTSTNHGDADDLKWDAVQVAFKLGYNPLVSSFGHLRQCHTNRGPCSRELQTRRC